MIPTAISALTLDYASFVHFLFRKFTVAFYIPLRSVNLGKREKSITRMFLCIVSITPTFAGMKYKSFLYFCVVILCQKTCRLICNW